MANDSELLQTLRRIEGQQSKLFDELTCLIKESTTAIVEMKNHLKPPFWKTGAFWYTILAMVLVFSIAYKAIENNGCFEIQDFAVIGCEMGAKK